LNDPYAKWARFYNPLLEPLLRPLKKEIVQECARAEMKRVLDIGSGTGTLCQMLQREGISATGLDPSPGMIGVSRQSQLNSVFLIRGRGEILPFPSRSVEGIVMSFVLHENDPLIRKRILQEASRVLSPGGSLFILDYDRPGNLPGRAAAALEYAVERAVGDTHFRNYRFFMQTGALTGLMANMAPEKLYRRPFFFGSIALVKYSLTGAPRD
jgi:ubiquinone/menaquinone biosynthesis C-methylase UbiE